jgi:hypothetical protein
LIANVTIGDLKCHIGNLAKNIARDYVHVQNHLGNGDVNRFLLKFLNGIRRKDGFLL